MLRAIPRMTSSVHVNILTSLDRNYQYASSASDVIPNTIKVIPFATITLPGSVIPIITRTQAIPPFTTKIQTAIATNVPHIPAIISFFVSFMFNVSAPKTSLS